MRILVVDDEPSILRSTQLLLEDMGFEVLTASDHTQVVPTLLKHRPDLLLQDVRMPGLDLDRLVSSIRERQELARLPILLFSASMDLDEIHDRVKAAGVIEKPFNPREVAQAIEAAHAGGSV